MKRFWVLAASIVGIVAYGLRRNLLAWWLELPLPLNHVQIKRGLMIPAQDGVGLCSDHYFPIATAKCPTILIRSPYGRNSKLGPFGMLTEFSAFRFAERGYNVIVQDIRGRFDSKGDFEPFLHEREDALATFDWLRHQSWFDGQVGMWGPSYLGIVQWVVADDPLVKALVPGVTASNLYDIIFPDGAFDLSLIMRWMSLLRFQDKLVGWIRQIAVMLYVERDVRPSFDHLPIIQSDEAMREGKVSYYRRWINSMRDDPVISNQLRTIDHNKVDAPIHLIGGWYDFFLRGMLKDYAALRAAGQTPYLTVGPWRHVSNLFLMPTMLKPGIDWFDTQLKHQPERLRSNPVRIYVMGADEWRDYPDYPPPSDSQTLYLQSGNCLGRQSTDAVPSRYCYDPKHPTPSLGGAQFSLWAGPRDNHKLEGRPDVLLFTTDPLTQPVEIIGNVRCELYFRSSSEFTDFCVRLCDVHSDGHSINICDGFIRVEPGKCELHKDGSLRAQIDFWATACRFLTGHRIRLLVSSSAHPRWARHTNTANPLTDTVVRVAEQTIYHDTNHPSALVLPVMDIK